MQRALRTDDALWLLGSLCSLKRIPFDPALIAQHFPPPITRASLHEAARALGFQTGSRPIRNLRDGEHLLPAIAFLRDPPPETAPSAPADPAHTASAMAADCSSSSGDPPPQAPRPPASAILIVGLSEEHILYFRPGQQTAESLTRSEAAERLEPELMLLSRTAGPATTDEDGIPGFAPDRKVFGFSWFIPELLKHRRLWLEILTASLFIQLVGLVTPLFTQVIIDKVIVHQTHSTLIVLAVALVLFLFFTAGMTWLRQYLILHTGSRIDAVLGSQVLRHLLRLPLAYFENRPTGTLVARLHGVETLREFVSGAAVALILDGPFLLIFLAVMFAYSWQLSLIAVSLLSLIALLSLLVAPVFREKINRQFMLAARNQSFLTEYIAGIGTVKSLQMEPDIDQKYGDLLAQYLASGFSTKQVGNTYHVIANALEQVMTLSILVVGALLVMKNEGFTVGMLVAFQMFAGRMSQPMLRLVGLWQEFQQANIALKRLGDILDMPQEPHALIPSRENRGEGLLTIRNLAFRYGETLPWLYSNLDIAFKPGHLSVITGPSGCGKSTLAKLMLGFYQPQEGGIALDGQDIRYLAANELRAAFGVVPQETVLFSGTLYDNLVMAHPHASFEDVIAACKAAEIHDVIERLPGGYQTEIGERGTGLSGGQRQRIAIARALLKRSKILIFDEAVSSLDQQTAEHLAQTINTLKGQVTMIFITHQIPRGLQVDEVFSFAGDNQPTTRVEVVGAEKD